MEFAIIIAVLSLIALIALHELGHFVAAKYFGVKVEEFGMGIPPRIFGKKFGETIYSLNWLPLGAFVRMSGEEERNDDPRSFSQKPVWQRFIIVSAGVIVFWIVGAIILGILGATSGIPSAVDDDSENVRNPKVQIVSVAEDSPAEDVGIEVSDVVSGIEHLRTGELYEIGKVSELQEVVDEYRGQDLVFMVERGEESMEMIMSPREDPPDGEGAIGVGLTRVGMVQHAWYEAPWRGIVLTAELTYVIVTTLGSLASNLVTGDAMPAGVELRGPIGIVEVAGDSVGMGISYFMYFVAVISIHLAIFNTLPIPALDGGRMLFLLIESARGKPLPESIEQRSVAISFGILILLIIAVSVMDISRFI